MEDYPPPDAAVMDPQITGMTTPYPEPPVPPQQDVDEFLRKKRKAREHKACYPCRQRKVKCDLSRPCQTCRDRDHPELCSYHPPNKRQNMEQGHPMLKVEEGTEGSGFVTLGRGEFDMLCSKLDGLENSIAELKRELSLNSTERHSERYDQHDSNASAGASVYGAETRLRPPTHQEVHGIHTKNEAVRIWQVLRFPFAC